MRIAVDAMGGDHAPMEIVTGAVQAAKELNISVCLVGRADEIDRILKAESDYESVKGSITVVQASEVIEMGEHPATAVRKKRDSSLVVAASLVKAGECDAMVSAGNTGAAMVSSLLTYGRIRGVDRPAIASPMPTVHGHALVIDAGANADVKPINLLQFAEMGSIYMSLISGVGKPKVGLLNIGEEESKGNELSQAVYGMLKESRLNFIGNIEGRDIPQGVADIIVCDGFVGNIILKFAEGMGTSLFALIKREIEARTASKLGALLVKPAFRAVKKVMDYSEYGGAPLLGLNKITIISHGSSNAKAIRNAVSAAEKAVSRRVVEKIRDSIGGTEEGIEIE